MRRVAGLILTVSALLASSACGTTPDWGAVEPAGDERQRVECRGTVGPAVVAVHGIGDRASSASFARTLAALPSDRRVCRFDRPGAGDSPAPRHADRDGRALAAELDAVVREADPSAPVILLAHSFGSYPALIYTAGHRERVAGLVLADGVDPGFRLLPALGADSWSDVPTADEDLDLAAVEAQATAAVARTGAFADVPLVVVRRAENATPAWIAAQERLAALSGRAESIVADGSGHQIPEDAPAVLADAVARVAAG